MGCVGTKVDHESSVEFMNKYRREKGCAYETLIMGIKDQNMVGKVYLCGPGSKDKALLSAVTAALSQGRPGVRRVVGGADPYDAMWDVAWHGTKLTSGFAAFSFAKPFFPRGRAVVALLDSLAQQGWVPSAGPNFGGPISDKASNGWPSIVFSREDGTYTRETLFMAVKDQNAVGKLCVAGPNADVTRLKNPLLACLRRRKADVTCQFDEYDGQADWDAVFLNTSITSGMQFFSFSKPYFPKGNVVVPVLQEAYNLGWRLVAAPNFGGGNVDWPCFIFRKLAKPPASPPQLVMAAIKDQNIPGKVCFHGLGAAEAAQNVLAALQAKARHHGDAKLEKDQYDRDWDCVIRNTEMTNGRQFAGLSYFPKNRPVLAMLNAMNEAGYKLAACPNFGGGGAVSWPTFVWEKREEPVRSALVAIKDRNWPGKVCVGGVSDASLREALLRGLDALATSRVLAQKDAWDQDFDLAFSGTAMTTGSVPFSLQNAWFPFGFPLEVLVTEMGRRGWKVVGGPNFGSGRDSWPVLVFEASAQRPRGR